MSRFQGIYSLVQTSVSVTTSHELHEITAPSDRTVTILRAWIGPGTDATPADEILEVRMGVVSVSGNGAAATPQLLNPNYSAVGATATGNGATVSTISPILVNDGFHVQSGFLWKPDPEERIVIAGSDVFGWIIPTAPGAGINLTWGLIFGVG